MSAKTLAEAPTAAGAGSDKAQAEPTPKKVEEERPPQQEQLLCTICHLPACSR
ncbi:MAG: hypothetical protein JOZ87_00170 [Chloroflexi bacterium]|nr:hypothetical protein [Chloroflexota bacterium]